jgi:SAM-dependent methyltransferase
MSSTLNFAKRLTSAFEKRVLGGITERRLGVQTAGTVGAEALGYTDEETHPYQPAEWRALARAFPRGMVSETDVFVDLGSGMGRAVLMATQFPFRRVIGVELSPQLHQVAVENLEQARIEKRDRVEFICDDVREYQVPDDVTFVFMYNPFSGEVFDGAMRQVFESYDRKPRQLRIVYRFPLEHERLLATGRVRVLSEKKDSPMQGLPRRVGIVTYEVLPAAGEPSPAQP